MVCQRFDLLFLCLQARPGPMLRGGTVILLRQPQHDFLMQGRPFAGSAFGNEGPPDRFDKDTLDRIFDGPSILGPPFHL